MTDETIQDWMEKAAKHSGILACGVRLANQSSSAKSFDKSYPEARIGDLLQCLAEVVFGLRNGQVGGSRIRWVFDNGQLYCARRDDGAVAVLAIAKGRSAAEAIEELFAEFLGSTVPLPEEQNTTLPEPAQLDSAPESTGGE